VGKVTHIYNPTHTGGMGKMIMVKGQNQAKRARTYLKNNYSKKGLGYGPSGRTPASK
jgi:hypothetical protein